MSMVNDSSVRITLATFESSVTVMFDSHIKALDFARDITKEPEYVPPLQPERHYAYSGDYQTARTIVAFLVRSRVVTGRIDTIKHLRNLTGLGLKEAKDMADFHMLWERNNPASLPK